MFVNTDSKVIWKNGTYEKWEDTSVHILSHTMHYGTGCFEGVRAYNTEKGPAIFRLEDHTNRLFEAANKLSINIPYSPEEINQVQKEIFAKNDLKEGYLRPIVFLGSESLGIRATELSVNVAVAAWEWPSYMSPEAKEAGISIIKSSYEQYSNPLHSGYKIIGTYINSTMALHEAINKGADEALLLDKNGFISEGSGENIFLIKDNIISTPLTDHCLNGITRQSVIQIATDLGYQMIEKDLTYEDLLSSDEAFFTGTAVEITPISKIDENQIGIGSRGPITEKLQTTYNDIIYGQNDLYKHWLSLVT
jgi:branched-chain amino acid aminotransferase